MLRRSLTPPTPAHPRAVCTAVLRADPDRVIVGAAGQSHCHHVRTRTDVPMAGSVTTLCGGRDASFCGVTAAGGSALGSTFRLSTPGWRGRRCWGLTYSSRTLQNYKDMPWGPQADSRNDRHYHRWMPTQEKRERAQESVKRRAEGRKLRTAASETRSTKGQRRRIPRRQPRQIHRR